MLLDDCAANRGDASVDCSMVKALKHEISPRKAPSGVLPIHLRINGFNNPVYAAIGTAHESLRVYPECAGVLRVTLVGARSDGLAHAGHQPLDIERRYANFQPGYGWTCRGGDVGRSK